MKTQIKSAQHLEEHELNILLNYLFKKELWRYYLLVRLGVSTALRYSDLSRLTWEDVLNQRSIVLKEKKTQKTREIPISSTLNETLSKVHLRLGLPKLEEPIISLHIRTVNQMLKKHAKNAGIKEKRISTHSFRKSFGRYTWKKNNYSESALIKLSYLFNHSSISITRIYLDITREEINDLYDIQDIFHT